MNEQNQKAEELFETLSKNKKKKRRKVIRTVLIIVAVIAVILVGLVFYLRNQVRERFASSTAEVESYEVTTGTINTVVSGSGSLTQVDVETISVPEGVEITEVLVENRAEVKQGDILATVDMATVMTALSDTQEALDDLDDEIADAKATLSAAISPPVSPAGSSGSWPPPAPMSPPAWQKTALWPTFPWTAIWPPTLRPRL